VVEGIEGEGAGVNKNVFQTGRAPRADATNDAGGRAYSLPAKHAVAQLAATGCFGGTYYAKPEAQLDSLRNLVPQVPDEFIAKAAVYARRRGYMKDMPAVLLAFLAEARSPLLERVFPLVIDNGKMLRNFILAVRSESVGRKTFGQGARRALRKWFTDRDAADVFRANVGKPSMRDVLRIVHPKPESKVKDSLYAYLLGKVDGKRKGLPALVRQFEAWKENPEKCDVPDVPFQMLTGIEIPDKVWHVIAENAKWHMTRMNLNTFARHGVFESKKRTRMIATRLRDPENVRKAKAFPYQLLAAYKNVTSDVPHEVREALQDAMEIAIENVPAMKGNVVVCPDVSGSMRSPITGYDQAKASTIRCVDIAGLVAAAVMRKNPSARAIPFEGDVVNVRLNSRDTVLTNAEKLADVGGGSTNCSAPLRMLNEEKADVDVVVFVSDNESWVDSERGYFYYGRSKGTGMMEEWAILKKRCPKAKLVCIDLTPTTSSQVKDRADILQVGGFSDAVFDIVDTFLRGDMTAEHWVGEIEKVEF